MNRITVGSRRQSQLRQDHAVQRADRRPPAGGQLAGRHRRAQDRRLPVAGRGGDAGGSAGRVLAGGGVHLVGRRADRPRLRAVRRGRPDRQYRRCLQPRAEPLPDDATARNARPDGGRSQHDGRGPRAPHRHRHPDAGQAAGLPGGSGGGVAERGPGGAQDGDRAGRGVAEPSGSRPRLRDGTGGRHRRAGSAGGADGGGPRTSSRAGWPSSFWKRTRWRSASARISTGTRSPGSSTRRRRRPTRTWTFSSPTAATGSPTR